MEDLGGIWGFRAFACSLDFPCGSDGKASAYNAGDPRSIPGLGRSQRKGNGNPLQHSCLENPIDRGVWQAIIHGVSESDTTELLTHTHVSLKELVQELRTFLAVQWLRLHLPPQVHGFDPWSGN